MRSKLISTAAAALIAAAPAVAFAASPEDGTMGGKGAKTMPSETTPSGAAADAPATAEPKSMSTTNAATDAEMARPLSSDPSIDEKALVGMDVRNLQGEELGDIEDVATQSADLKKYVVVGHGGVLGIGEKEIAVPFDKAKLSPDGKIVYVDLSVTQLEQAPSFDSGDRQWLQDKSWLERNTEFLNSGEDSDRTMPKSPAN